MTIHNKSHFLESLSEVSTKGTTQSVVKSHPKYLHVHKELIDYFLLIPGPTHQ